MEAQDLNWRKKKRTTTARKEWKDIFEVVRKRYHTNAFTLRDIQDIIHSYDTNLTLSRESLRVKLSRYCKKGVLTKAGRGRYALNTDMGNKYFDVTVREIARLKDNEARDYEV